MSFFFNSRTKNDPLSYAASWLGKKAGQWHPPLLLHQSQSRHHTVGSSNHENQQSEQTRFAYFKTAKVCLDETH